MKIKFKLLFILTIGLGTSLYVNRGLCSENIPPKAGKIAEPKVITDVKNGKLPKAGTNAYWAHNPGNPRQKILLVPSVHTFNFRFINPELANAMKSSDILIIEKNITELISWDDETMFRAQLPKLELLSQYNIVKSAPILVKGKPWTSYITPASKDYLTKTLQPFLKAYSLDQLHPVIVAQILLSIMINKVANVGMDRQIYRYFDLNKKPKLTLETMEEHLGISEVDKLENWKGATAESPDQPDIYQNIDLFIANLKAINKMSPNALLEQTMENIKQMKWGWYNRVGIEDIPRRNELWIPRLVDYLNQNKNASIVVVVGVLHFSGPEGIVSLLSQKPYNFTFTPFAGG